MGKNIKERLLNVCKEYVKAFEKQTGCKLQYSIDENYLGVLCFSDYFFNFKDIVFVVDNNISFEKLDEWYNYALEAGQNSKNFEQWYNGEKKYTDEELEEAKAKVEKAKKIFVDSIIASNQNNNKETLNQIFDICNGGQT